MALPPAKGSIMVKRISTVLAAVLLALGLGLTASASAQAANPSSEDDLELASCLLGEHDATYTPPLGSTPAPTTITNSYEYGTCVSVTEPGITSATSTSVFTPPAISCLVLGDQATRDFTITWDDGRTSTLHGTSLGNVVGASLVTVTTGTVESGVFAGSTFVQTVTAPSLEITTCTLGLGTVSSLTGVLTLAIVA